MSEKKGVFLKSKIKFGTESAGLVLILAVILSQSANRYHLVATVCVCDFYRIMQEPFLFGVLIMPVILFLLLEQTKDRKTLNYYCRVQGRIFLWNRIVKKVLWYSGIFTLLLGGTAFVVGCLKTDSLYNWDQYESVFYLRSQMLVSVSWVWVMAVNLLLIWIKITVLALLHQVFLLLPKSQKYIWLLVVALGAIETFQRGRFFFLVFYPEDFLWNRKEWTMGLLAGGIVLAAGVYAIGRRISGRRDILDVS